jgi:hypothetical protein
MGNCRTISRPSPLPNRLVRCCWVDPLFSLASVSIMLRHQDSHRLQISRSSHLFSYPLVFFQHDVSTVLLSIYMGPAGRGIPGVTAFNGNELALSATPSPSMLTCSTIRLRAHLRQGKIFHPPTHKKKVFFSLVYQIGISTTRSFCWSCLLVVGFYFLFYFFGFADHHDETFPSLSPLTTGSYGFLSQRENLLFVAKLLFYGFGFIIKKTTHTHTHSLSLFTLPLTHSLTHPLPSPYFHQSNPIKSNQNPAFATIQLS